MTGTRNDWLKWVAAGFALVATASAEYELARAIGMNQWIAAAVPGALDAYAVRALRAHREVLTAVLAMVSVNAASHLVSARLLPVDWILITAVSAIAPLVLWRVHALGTPGEWRTRKLWDVSADGHTASTEPEPEHGRGNDDQGVPGDREHPEHAAVSAAPPLPVRAPGATLDGHGAGTFEAVSLASTPDHEPFPYVWEDADTPSTPVLRLVPHVDTEDTTPITDHGHVSTGVLHPSDTPFLERARVLAREHGSVPGVRALKLGLNTGTARAQRVRAALEIEHGRAREESTS